MPDDRDAARSTTRRPANPATTDAARAANDQAAHDRTPNDRAADHAGIERLVDGLVPALIAKLGTLNVGELEVHEGDWRIRLRRPAGAGPAYGRRATDRPSRAHPGHEQHAHPPAAPEPHRAARAGNTPGAGHAPGSADATNGRDGRGGPGLAPVGPGRTTEGSLAAGDRAAPTASAAGPDRSRIATSPAVGVFQPGPKAVGGTRVRAGDRLGVVDMLGVPQDVVSPVDGIVVGVIVEGGTAVEYGQELIHLEPAVPVEGR